MLSVIQKNPKKISHFQCFGKSLNSTRQTRLTFENLVSENMISDHFLIIDLDPFQGFTESVHK